MSDRPAEELRKYRLRSLALAAIVVGVNVGAGCWIAALKSRSEPEAFSGSIWSPNGPFYYEKADGSRVMMVSSDGGLTYSSPVVVRPASWIGLARVWWPVAVSGSFSLVAIGLARTRIGRALLTYGRLPRLTMFRGMVAIGVIAAEFWLYRIDGRLAGVGGFVLLLLLHSAYRRRYLSKSDRVGSARSKVLTRLVVAGYVVAAILASAWFVCVYIWDVLQIRRP